MYFFFGISFSFLYLWGAMDASLVIEKKNPGLVLLAEDDDDHYFLIQNAFKGSNLKENLYRVTNGVDLMHYLLHEGKYQNLDSYEKPIMIILDLNLPKKDGRQVLKEIRANDEFKDIPVSILTTSINEEDKINSYGLGVKHFIKKPVLFKEYVKIVQMLRNEWI